MRNPKAVSGKWQEHSSLMVSQQCDRKRRFCHSSESSLGPPSPPKGESQWFTVSQRIFNYFCKDETSCDSGENMTRQARSGAHWCVAAASHRETSSCRGAPDGRGHLPPQQHRPLPHNQKACGDRAHSYTPPPTALSRWVSKATLQGSLPKPSPMLGGCRAKHFTCFLSFHP